MAAGNLTPTQLWIELTRHLLIKGNFEVLSAPCCLCALFLCFVDLECVCFAIWRITSLLFADDVAILAPAECYLQLVAGWFSAKCDAYLVSAVKQWTAHYWLGEWPGSALKTRGGAPTSHGERVQLVLSRHLIRIRQGASLFRVFFPGTASCWESQSALPGLRISSGLWLPRGFPGRAWKLGWEDRHLQHPPTPCCPWDAAPD